MIIRPLLAIFIIIALFMCLRWFRNNAPQQVSRALKKAALFLVIGLVIFLAISGRLHWIAVLVAALIPFIRRLLPLLRYLPLLGRWLGYVRGRREQVGNNQQQTPRPNNVGMSVNEAIAILGLEAPLKREAIIHAHRQLISKHHPDRGGSTYIAAKLNQAKDLLLKDVA